MISTYMWDVGVQVHYLKGLGPSEEQSLQMLSKKLVTLLALANTSRASDLHALDLQRVFFFTSRLSLRQEDRVHLGRPLFQSSKRDPPFVLSKP